MDPELAGNCMAEALEGRRNPDDTDVRLARRGVGLVGVYSMAEHSMANRIRHPGAGWSHYNRCLALRVGKTRGYDIGSLRIYALQVQHR